MNMSRYITINDALWIHINAAYKLHLCVRSHILVVRGKDKYMKRQQRLTESFVHTAFTLVTFLLPLCFSLIAEYILYLSSGAVSCTTLYFIHFNVYLSHDGLLRKTSVSCLEGAHFCPRWQSWFQMRSVFFFFCLLTCFLFFFSFFLSPSIHFYFSSGCVCMVEGFLTLQKHKVT